MFPKSLSATLTESSYYPAIAAEFQPERLMSSLVAGGITGLIGVIRAISYAALIFSGSLASDLNVGVGMAVLSSALISIVVALTSSLPGMIATPLAAPTVVLTFLAAGIAQQIDPVTHPQDILPTVIAAIALGSLMTGLVLWISGQFRWGNAMEFLPYPVVGGFMAGTGLLLVRGAFKVMTGEDLTLDHLGWLCQGEQSFHWLAGLVIAGVLLWATKQFHHYLMMPGILLVSTLLFYGAVWLYQVPLEVARDDGWLLGPFPEGNLWHPLTFDSLTHVQWGAIAQSSNILGLLVFVSLLSLILTNGSIELAVEKDLDLNRELKAVGLANFVAGLGSTMVGNQALPSTLLVHRLGATNRLTGIFKTLPCFLVLILGPKFLNYFPKPILGSLLLFLGLDLLWKWLYGAWSKLSLVDYLIILVTLSVINVAGFIPGIGIGMGIAILQFLYHCSRLETVASIALETVEGKRLETLDFGEMETWDSTEAESMPTVSPFGDRGVVDCLSLQGFLFFGTAKALCQQLCDRILLRPPSAPPLRYLLLDCKQVLGIDSSAAMSLSKLAKLAQKHDCVLVFCTLTDTHKSQLLRSQVLDLDATHCLTFPDLATALNWCHSQLQSTPALTTSERSPQDIQPPQISNADTPLQSST